jgi:hypothetical protein
VTGENLRQKNQDVNKIIIELAKKVSYLFWEAIAPLRPENKGSFDSDVH